MGIAISVPLQRLGRRVLDTVFPPLCLVCREEVSEPGSLCPACWQEVSFFDGPACAACGLPFEVDPGGETLCGACHARRPAFDAARSILRYSDASKGMILALKHGDRLDLVPGFARWLERAGRTLLGEVDVIVPVPLHPSRLFARRYNQAAELARSLGRRTGRPVDPLTLRRLRRTPSQGVMRSAKARKRNVAGAFRVAENRRDHIAGRVVLLIDDVFTTGATVEACATALKKAGAAKVLVLTLARVVRPLPGNL